jgi:hypothetical protein
MNQLHPRQDDSGGLASTRSGITRQGLLSKARHLTNMQQPEVGGVLTPAAAHLHGQAAGEMVSWAGRELLRFLRYRLRMTVRETSPTARLSVNGRAIAPVYPEGSHMTTRSTGLSTPAYQEPAAAPHAEVFTPADPSHDDAPRSWSQRC